MSLSSPGSSGRHRQRRPVKCWPARWPRVTSATWPRRRRAEKAAADARAVEREQLAMLNRMRGDPIGELSRSQMAVAASCAEVEDLQEQLSKAQGRLARDQAHLTRCAAEADQVRGAVAQRSEAPDAVLAPAKRVHAEFVAATRAAMAAAAAAPAPGAPSMGKAPTS